MTTRRKFIQKASVLSLVPFLMNGLYGCKSDNSTVKKAIENGMHIDQFGIQLWTVRDFMEEDPKNTLKQLSAFGYKQIESFQGGKGVFWGMDPKEYGMFLQDHGLQCISSHCNPQYALDPLLRDEFKQLVDDAASVGIKYLINPYLREAVTTIDGFKKVTEGFNELGEIAKAAGIRYGYHNHNYSFEKIDGEYPQDIMMQGSDKDNVDFEMDIYWVVTAGEDPIAWLEKYPNRFTLCHIKDRYKDEKIAELEKTDEVRPGFGVKASCVLGTGQIDFDKILQVAQKQGMQQYIVEQERFDNMTSMEAAQKDAAYMKKFA